MTTDLKHRWSISHNYLAGITAGDWLRLLIQNRFRISPAYWHRAWFVTLISLMNSVYRNKEQRVYGKAVEATDITDDPLFILGHWRSGTTHIHYLMAHDDQFAYANTYQVINPHTFLCTEEINASRFAQFVPKTRPMDNMSMSFQSPQEDEFAYCLKCFRSMYLGISFPERTEHYEKYLSFDDASPEEIGEWKEAVTWFAKKLTYKYKKRLLLKSPTHTARIRLILDLFPNAQFIHIQRNPYDVYRSFRHYYDTAMWYTYLQKPDMDTVNNIIINRYKHLYDTYFRDRTLIPDGNLHEIRFSDIEESPIDQLREVYRHLNLQGFESFVPTLRNYVESIANYEKNTLADLGPELTEKLNTAWKRTFDEWGYEIRTP